MPSPAPDGAEAFFTVGHSNRSTADFVDLLRESEVRLVVDVRKMPRSRANPQFNGDALAEALAEHQIGYAYVPELGGLRSRGDAPGPSPNGFWENRSFRNYADYALTPSYRAGLEQLLRLGRERRCAVMCAEAVWWRCHRRIIADYLLAGGLEVFHIMGPGRVDRAALTPGAEVTGPETVVYPASAG